MNYPLGSRTNSLAWSYDSFGNVTQFTRNGRASVAGDETTEATLYNPNTSAFITSLPARKTVYASSTASGTVLTDTYFTYDGAHGVSGRNVAPVNGDLTLKERLLDTNGTYPSEAFDHDSFGNVIQVTDAVGASTQLAFDPTFHIFPTTVTNALGQVSTTNWGDMVCGQPASQVDINNRTTGFSYDPLCRKIQTTFPSGEYENVGYRSIGSPTLQNIRKDLSLIHISEPTRPY